MTTFTGTDDDDIVTMTAAQWASFDVIDLGRGTLNVVVEGTIDISALVAPSIVNVETGILSSTTFVVVTLTGEQLDAIIIGAGKIDFRHVDQNTINLKSTSADLNTLADGSITGVVRIDASLATAGVTMNLSGERGHAMGEFEVTGSSFADTIIGGSGEGYISGGAGADTIIGGESNDVIDGGAGADTIVCYSSEVIYDGSDISIDATRGERSCTLIVQNAATIDLSLSDQTTGDTANVTGFDNVYASGLADAVSLTGNANANTFRGGYGADTISGGGGDNRIEAGNGDNTVMGGAGDNTIEGGNGDNWIDGGDGDDTIDGSTWSDDWSEDPDTLNGGAGDDTLVFRIGATTIDLNSSSDQTIGDTAIVTGFENVDASDSSTAVSLTCDANANELTGSRYADAIDGGDGDDTIHYWWEGGADTLDGGAGSDTLIVGRDATVDLNSLSDQTIGDTAIATGFENVASTYGAASLTGDANANVLTGGTGNDTITGGAGADTIGGGGGDDTITGGTGVSGSRLYGATGDDKITGGNGADRISGGAGADKITGENGADRIDGGAGADAINGGAGDDTVSGGAGADMLSGGAGNDVYVVDNTGDKVIESVSGGLDGIQSSITFSLVSVGTVETLTLTGSGNIKGTGNAYNNKLTGNTGANTLDGGAGNDMLNGGVGKDTLTGGVGKDTFFFNAALSAANSDKINDFSVADDTVRMENAVFAALKATGTLAESAFYAGAAAHDASDRIIYNKATGALSYDADGKGGTAAVQFATLGSGLALTHADFMVV